MEENCIGSLDHGGQTDEENSHSEKMHIEPIYDSFLCPLTKQVMREPVTLENGQTFERKAIEKWFKECRESGRKPVCPLTQKELRSTDLNPSIALRNTIEEWTARNEAALLDLASRTLSLGSPEDDILRALQNVQHICHKCRSNKYVVRNAQLIPMITSMLKSSIGRVRCEALETLRIVAEEDNDNKEAIAEGDTIRTIVKFLSHGQSQEKEEAVSLLYELSKCESLCEKVGTLNGAILILVGMTSSKSENITAEKAEKTLENLEKCENNVRQMAENGRLQPLITLLLEGSPETKVVMASYLGDLVLSNDVKGFVAKTVGASLVDFLRSDSMQAREAALKALNQISSCEASAKALMDAGILPLLIKELFTVGVNRLPMKLKEVSATVLANIVNLGCDFEFIPIGPNDQTLTSEDTIHKLLHLINNTGPNIECKLLQVLVGLTGSSSAVVNVVDAIKSSAAIISLIQFVEAPQKELRTSSIKLLYNLSLHMGQELAGALCGTAGLLGSLIKVISDKGITEEHASATGLLANLLEKDSSLTQLLLDEGAFELVISRIVRIRQGEVGGGRFFTPYLERLVAILARLTFILEKEPKAVALAQQHNITALFTDLLHSNGLDNIQMLSATALENLSKESKLLTRVPDAPKPGFCCRIFPCLSQQPVVTGLCPVHKGFCSAKESFCLLEGNAVGKLVTSLDHANEKVVGAALAALCTLLEDDVDIENGVNALYEAEGIKPIFDVLVENRTEVLQQRALWAVERILRTPDIAYEIAGNQNVATALVDSFRHGDYRTKQIAEKALKHVDKFPTFSGIFQKIG